MSRRIQAPQEGEIAAEFTLLHDGGGLYQLELDKKMQSSKRKMAEKRGLRLVLKRTAQDLEQQKQLLGGRTTDLPFTMNALNVVARRYLLRTLDGHVKETPEEMFARVAGALANVEKEYGATNLQVREYLAEFESVLTNFEFTPAGRTLANAGGPTKVVSNCIVLHIGDSMDAIFGTLRDASLLQQCGSGLGFPMHLLRPAGSVCKRTFGVASGPVSFLDVYNSSFAVIQQQNRHGANMAVMQVDHPDILEFIHCKDIEGDISNFNISVGLTDEFMERVRDNDPRPWVCHFGEGEKRVETYPRRISRSRNFRLQKIEEVKMTALELWDEIVESAWRTGEPGCVMLDTVNKSNPVPGLGRIECCNPCGEQFLHDGDVCNLGAINLDRFVKTDPKTGNPVVDYEHLGSVARTATRMLDNVIDVTDFPVPRVTKTFRGNRRIGLGIMGFADMLYQLNIGYDTQEGRDLAEKVMGHIQANAHAMSEELGRKKGTFPYYSLSTYARTSTIRRNAAITNVAPTGTIGMMFDVSGGIEPFFALAYYYKGILGGTVQLTYVNKHLKKALQRHGLFTEAMMARIIQEGSLQHIPEIPDAIKRVFVTAQDISAESHILMQAAFQRHCDNAISKTINFPNSATKEDITRGYLLAWENGCKGCTVYRDGSRQEQVLNTGDEKAKPKAEPEQSPSGLATAETTTSEVVGEIVDELTSQTKVVVPDKENALNAAPKKRQAKRGNRMNPDCPDCGQGLVFQEGCAICANCGFSACSR